MGGLQLAVIFISHAENLGLRLYVPEQGLSALDKVLFGFCHLENTRMPDLMQARMRTVLKNSLPTRYIYQFKYGGRRGLLQAPTHVWSLKMLSQKMRTKTKVYELGGWREGRRKWACCKGREAGTQEHWKHRVVIYSVDIRGKPVIKKTVFLFLIMWLCGGGMCTHVPVPSEVTGSEQPVQGSWGRKCVDQESDRDEQGARSC